MSGGKSWPSPRSKDKHWQKLRKKEEKKEDERRENEDGIEMECKRKEELQRLGWAEALCLFAASDLRPDAFVFGVLANAFGKASQWRQALQCLEDMAHQQLSAPRLTPRQG